MEKKKNIISKKQYAYEILRSRILDGIYGPGHRIVIDQIAKELQLSPIPVREAIRQLEADGLIQYKPYSGAIVSTVNESEYLDNLSVLAVLEGFATALSSRSITEESIKLLEQMNEEMKEALFHFELDQFGILNRRFHGIIVEHSGNALLIERIQSTWELMPRFRQYGFSYVPHRARESIGEHALIIQMIKEKAPSREIEELVRKHFMATAKAFQKKMGNESESEND
ncbi:GntR family transcriptional regulator [Collibacillus ludicampi]|jgi:DNA-binding GntR family transcriptional regulator|uniref:GntR family transcriptional regulator n=1 Tax=Collibacillus ludicampi TaxID=2771369 RepID=A0AAV4LG35_9BACL|nr:GntR family transcriptional regulator [Collibacillus ludicampi]GIM46787.1 GntR family transcriptional regulator [Collibacillus ludicampi]